MTGRQVRPPERRMLQTVSLTGGDIMAGQPQDKDRKIDQAIAHTFPASDPTAHSRATSTEPASRPADREAPAITREQIEMAQRGEGHRQAGENQSLLESEPVDHPDRQSVEVRQGTGPRATVSVLLVSLLLAVTAGALLLAYYFT
jgi:hypothetical protein